MIRSTGLSVLLLSSLVFALGYTQFWRRGQISTDFQAENELFSSLENVNGFTLYEGCIPQRRTRMISQRKKNGNGV